jgi:peroxiredoxin
MGRTLVLLGLLWPMAATASAADRAEEFESLVEQYDAVWQRYFAARSAGRTAAEKIRDYEAWPGWEFTPLFLALAEAEPSDATAYRCCLWIFDRSRDVGNSDFAMYGADQRAWEIIAEHHAAGADDETYQLLCFRAVEYDGAAQEQFLRAERERQQTPRRRAIATLALAQLLADKLRLEGIRDRVMQNEDEFSRYGAFRWSPEWGRDLTEENSAAFRDESMALFREALANDADEPITVSAPGFRELKTVADKASASLYALEHLSIGAEAPAIVGHDLAGEPLELAAFRGRVVVLVFWDSSNDLCMEMISQQRALAERYAGRPFAALAVCVDASREQGMRTAQEQGIAWPCWYDGQNGPIARRYNQPAAPTTYVLDAQGIISATELSGAVLDAMVAELMER